LKVSAQQAADRIAALAAANAHAGYFETVIVPAGLETAQTMRPTADELTAYRTAARAVPLHVRIVQHSMADLQAVSGRIRGDTAGGMLEGVPVANWGPDYASDLVVVRLVKYVRTAAAAIESRYGPLVTVSTEPTPKATA
jgi:hypothetical protein